MNLTSGKHLVLGLTLLLIGVGLSRKIDAAPIPDDFYPTCKLCLCWEWKGYRENISGTYHYIHFWQDPGDGTDVLVAVAFPDFPAPPPGSNRCSPDNCKTNQLSWDGVSTVKVYDYSRGRIRCRLGNLPAACVYTDAYGSGDPIRLEDQHWMKCNGDPFPVTDP